MVKFTYEPLNNGMYAGHGLVLLSCKKPLDLGSVSHQEHGNMVSYVVATACQAMKRIRATTPHVPPTPGEVSTSYPANFAIETLHDES